MAKFKTFVSKIVARIDERVDRAPDPDALTGRGGARRHGLSVKVPVRPVDRPTADQPSNADVEQDAQDALERIRTEQQRRMRRGSFGRRQDGQ